MKSSAIARPKKHADPAAVESVDGIPQPLHDCIYHDNPEWLEWLLDHGPDIERREQRFLTAGSGSIWDSVNDNQA